jgi:hypothetical protein
MIKKASVNPDPEIAAISEVYAALQELDSDAQARVLRYVAEKLKLLDPIQPSDGPTRTKETDDTHSAKEPAEHSESKVEENPELEGISGAGRKWITRSGIPTNLLSSVFSLGGDEIDLIAKSVPGNSKTKRMRSVILLKGLASYLGTGAARLTDHEVRETCLHYDALDAGNYATIIKGLASEVTGSKETGYTLSARGQASATEMVKSMVVPGKAE